MNLPLIVKPRKEGNRKLMLHSAKDKMKRVQCRGFIGGAFTSPSPGRLSHTGNAQVNRELRERLSPRPKPSARKAEREIASHRQFARELAALALP
ncbi:unnamed protein product [Lampetra planeri]